MILLEKPGPEPAKHLRNAQFILAMPIHGTGIKHHVLHGAHSAHDAAARVPAPQIPVDHHGRNRSPAVEMPIAQQPRHDLIDGPRDQRAEIGIGAVVVLAFGEDG